MLLLVSGLQAQISDGSTAPNFTATDINGNTWNLYQILNSGKSVVMDISATWCGPCWSYHESHALKDLYTQYGPDGTDELMVLFIEGDGDTGLDELNGTGNTDGDWVTGTPYPIIDDESIAQLYEIGYYPTIFLICPDKTIEEIGQISTSAIYSKVGQCPGVEQFAADFTAQNTTINEGQSVNFLDLSSANPVSWSWTFEGGVPATSTSQNPTVSYATIGSYDVSLTVTDAGGNTRTETKTDYIQVVSPTLCEGGATNISYEYISNVTFGSINNSSSVETGGYSDYLSLSTDIMEGASESFSVSIGNPYASDQVFIWVDWNNDLDFDDANESVFVSATSTGPMTGSITVPSGTSAGLKSMRIRMEDSANSPIGTPCGDSKYGEVEDYSINVISSGSLSNNASLTDLSSGGVSINGFQSNVTSYNVELPFGTTTFPSVTGVPADAGATTSVSNSGSLPGSVTILVTAEDGVSTNTYVINYTVAGRSLFLMDEQGDNISGTEFTVYGVISDDEILAHATVKNVGNKTVGVKVKKEVVSSVPGSTNLFCWVNCFLPNTIISPITVSMAPNDVNTDDFAGHYKSNGNVGITTVKYTFHDENNEADDAYIIVHYNVDVTGVQELKSEIQLYPNPAQDFLSFKGEMSNGLNVQILDLQGKVLMTRTVSSSNPSIEISMLPVGKYIVRCMNENTTSTHALIKF